MKFMVGGGEVRPKEAVTNEICSSIGEAGRGKTIDQLVDMSGGWGEGKKRGKKTDGQREKKEVSLIEESRASRETGKT